MNLSLDCQAKEKILSFVTVHTILGFPMGGAYLYKDIFARFKTTGMWRKQDLPSAFDIQKENWGNHAFF